MTPEPFDTARLSVRLCNALTNAGLVTPTEREGAVMCQPWPREWCWVHDGALSWSSRYSRCPPQPSDQCEPCRPTHCEPGPTWTAY